MHKTIASFIGRNDLLIVLLICSSTSCIAQSDNSKSIDLEEYSRIEKSARSEVSGIVKSRNHDNVFWVHGDKGNDPVIFPINKNGEVVADHKNGVELTGIDNIDWEEIIIDDAGNLFVGDIGDNDNDRDDVSFLIFPEPDLNQTEQSDYKRIWIKYPDLFRGLTNNNNQNAEAAFFMNDAIYLLTKEEENGENTQLYKLSDWEENTTNTLTHLTTFDFDDRVTAADLSADGSTLAVLTKSSVWLFSGFEGEQFFSGSSGRLTFEADQVESITFTDEESLIIAEEKGQMYEIPLSAFN